MRYLTLLFIFLLTACSSVNNSANESSSNETVDVYFAGVSFVGNHKDNKMNYPYSIEIAKKYPLDHYFLSKLKDIHNPFLNLITDLSNDSSAKALSLALDLENVSVSKIDAKQYKVVIDIYAEILLFDFGDKKIISSYPVNVQYITMFNHNPSKTEIIKLIEALYLGNNPEIKINIIDIAINKINSINIKTSYGNYLKVNNVAIGTEAQKVLKQLNMSQDTFKTLAAQSFRKSLVDTQKVAMLPYTKGQAIGAKMTARFANGDVYNLSIPKGDYNIDLAINNFKTLDLVDKSTKTQSFFVYSNIKLIQSDLNIIYMDMNMRGGESAVLMVNQTPDLKASYIETMMNSFDKFAKNISKVNSDWLNNSIAPELHNQAKEQINAFYGAVKKCQ